MLKILLFTVMLFSIQIAHALTDIPLITFDLANSPGSVKEATGSECLGAKDITVLDDASVEAITNTLKTPKFWAATPVRQKI